MGVWDKDYRHWLMKAEPDVYPIEQWKKDKVTFWDGVRNYTARNFMRDKMKKGDGMFFYYSGSKPSGIIGVGEIVKTGYPDHTAFDPKDVHFDGKSDPAKPTWYMGSLVGSRVPHVHENGLARFQHFSRFFGRYFPKISHAA